MSAGPMSARSRFHLAGHPVHVMLVDFPIALFSAALLFDLTCVATGDGSWCRAALYDAVLGYALALAAVATGAVDLFLVIPAHRRSYQAAATHALFAVAALLLYGAGLAIRYAGLARAEAASPALIALSAVGVALLWAAAWYGGELVFRYGIGLAGDAAARA